MIHQIKTLNEDKEKLEKCLENSNKSEKYKQKLTEESPLVKMLNNELDYLKKELYNQKTAFSKELAKQKKCSEEEIARHIEASNRDIKAGNEELSRQIESRIMFEKVSPLNKELEEIKQKYNSLENEFVEALMTESSRFKKLKCAFDISDSNFKRCKKEQETLKVTLSENLTLLAELNEIVKQRKGKYSLLKIFGFTCIRVQLNLSIVPCFMKREFHLVTYYSGDSKS